MTFDSLCRLAAAAGLASATAAASAQSVAPEVTVPLGSNCPPYGYGSTYGDVSGVVYDRHGGAYGAYYDGKVPARYPVERIPVQYLRYYPAAWYGLPGSTLPVVAPQVHMPTDTTQLGFYHQRVPTWMPVPGMIPPPPNPTALHTFTPMGYAGAGVAADGAVVSGADMSGSVSNERVISVRTLNTGSSHSNSGQTVTDPNEVPVPPAPSGSNELPLQPPPAPAAEPNAFMPPSDLEALPTIRPLMPVGLDE